jgi:anti-sigma B factor antagonist
MLFLGVQSLRNDHGIGPHAIRPGLPRAPGKTGNGLMSSVWSQKNGEVLVIYFNDAKILDESRINQIHADLSDMVGRSEHGKIVLNFQNVGFMSSAMIGKLILIHKKCKADKLNVKLSNISANIMEVFKIMKLNKLFDIHPDEAQAVKAFEKAGWFG